MDFNKQKCLELMVESNKLLQQGKSLRDYDKAKNKELTQYLTLLYDDIFWKSRYQYLQILESFISRSIDIDELIQKFNDLRGSNMKASKMREENLENEIDLQLNPQSRGFTKIISSIDTTIDLFDPDITLDMNLKHPELIGYGISEEFLKLDLKDNFLPRICEYCKES
jgi:hypothetical protein